MVFMFKKGFTVLALLSTVFVFGQNYTPTDAGSKVRFVIKNFGINTGGTFEGVKGTITFDPAQLAKGVDPQLVRAVQEALKLIKEKPRTIYPRPAFEDRSAKGLKEY